MFNTLTLTLVQILKSCLKLELDLGDPSLQHVMERVEDMIDTVDTPFR
jgi:hypothetical protein